MESSRLAWPHTTRVRLRRSRQTHFHVRTRRPFRLASAARRAPVWSSLTASTTRLPVTSCRPCASNVLSQISRCSAFAAGVAAFRKRQHDWARADTTVAPSSIRNVQASSPAGEQHLFHLCFASWRFFAAQNAAQTAANALNKNIVLYLRSILKSLKNRMPSML